MIRLGECGDIDEIAADLADGEGAVGGYRQRDGGAAGGIIDVVRGPDRELMEVGQIRDFEAQGRSLRS